jgi:RarD protein
MKKLRIILAMIIVGTIGIFVEYINLPSLVIATARAWGGAAFMLLVMFCLRKQLHWNQIKKNAVFLIISGISMGGNWIFLFESYKYVSIAIAILCDYMAPVFVIMLSPILLKEKITWQKTLCIAGAIYGMFLISGIVGNVDADIRGVALGLLSAVMYSSMVICNKKIKDMDGIEKTFCQMLVAAVVIITYTLLTVDVSSLNFTKQSILLLIVVGVVHTGIAYLLFIPVISQLPAITTSVLSYIEPVVAILTSALILKQALFIQQIIGTILILGSTLLCEASPDLRKIFIRTK